MVWAVAVVEPLDASSVLRPGPWALVSFVGVGLLLAWAATPFVSLGVAFLSRVTFGLPLYALAVGLALRLLFLQVRQERQPLTTVAARLALVLLPALAAGLFHLRGARCAARARCSGTVRREVIPLSSCAG